MNRWVVILSWIAATIIFTAACLFVFLIFLAILFQGEIPITERRVLFSILSVAMGLVALCIWVGGRIAAK